MRNLLRLMLSVAAVSGMTTSAGAAPLALDYFATPNTGGFVNIGGGYNTTVGPTANVGDLGASRTIRFTGTDGGVPGGAQYAIGNNNFSVSVPPDDIVQTSVAYTGLPSTAFNPGAALFLSLSGVDQAFTIGLDLLSGGEAGTVEATGDFNVAAIPGVQSIPFFFAGLTGTLGNFDTVRFRFNTTDVEALDFNLTANGGPPVTFDPNTPVPEPATLATFGLMGLMGLMGGYVARRRAKKAVVA